MFGVGWAGGQRGTVIGRQRVLAPCREKDAARIKWATMADDRRPTFSTTTTTPAIFALHFAVPCRTVPFRAVPCCTPRPFRAVRLT